MYSQNDLDEAVAAGALSAESATSLRNFIEAQRSLPAVDEEQFRLITGFNDIFVSIAGSERWASMKLRSDVADSALSAPAATASSRSF